VEPLRDLVLMAGQSNMVGYRTSVLQLRPKWRKPFKDTVIWHDGAWHPMEPGTGPHGTGFGPELSFAREWTATSGRPLAIVKVARSATWLRTHWHPEGRGGLYRQLIDTARAAMATGPVALQGLVWMQGESDSLDQGAADAYARTFALFLARLRNDLGVPRLPVVAGLVNPPVASFPYVQTVRAAFEKLQSDGLHLVGCDDLPKRKDDLHYTPVGISRLGHRFADKLRSVAESAPAVVPRRWLWNCDQFQAWYEGPDNPAGVMVCLPFASKQSGFMEPAFAQSYLSKRNVPAVYVRCDESDWFQNDKVFALGQTIRASLGDRTTITVYGASMGAHGALLMSGSLQARRAIAVAPQYSIDRADMPRERRWKIAATKIGRFRHRIEDHLRIDCDKIVLFDPYDEDRRQIARLAAIGHGWRFVALPFSSHQVLRFLLECGVIDALLEDPFGAGTDVGRLRRAVRQRRRRSSIYWATIAQFVMARWPEISQYAIDQLTHMGERPRMLRRLQASLLEQEERSRQRDAARAG
jgi:hypothetical protein